MALAIVGYKLSPYYADVKPINILTNAVRDVQGLLELRPAIAAHHDMWIAVTMQYHVGITAVNDTIGCIHAIICVKPSTDNKPGLIRVGLDLAISIKMYPGIRGLGNNIHTPVGLYGSPTTANSHKNIGIACAQCHVMSFYRRVR